MLKKILAGLLITCVIFIYLFYKGFFMTVFNTYPTSYEAMANEFSLYQIDYQNYQQKIIQQKTVIIPMIFHNLNLSDNSIVVLYSYGNDRGIIYYGNYNDKIDLNIPISYFSQEEGLDAIKFVFYDKDKMKSYVLEQEVPNQFWQPNKEVHVYFLPYREYYDEQFNLFIGYRIELKDIEK